MVDGGLHADRLPGPPTAGKAQPDAGPGRRQHDQRALGRAGLETPSRVPGEGEADGVRAGVQVAADLHRDLTVAAGDGRGDVDAVDLVLKRVPRQSPALS